MDSLANNILFPQTIKDILAQLSNIGNTCEISKDLEGSNVHARFHLNVLQPVGDQLICNDDRMFLRRLAEKVIIRNLRLGVVKTILLGQEVVDRSSTVTKNRMSLQKFLNNGQTGFCSRVRRCDPIVLFFKLSNQMLDVLHC